MHSLRKRRKVVEEDSLSEIEKTVINTAKNASKNAHSFRTRSKRRGVDIDDDDNDTTAMNTPS